MRLRTTVVIALIGALTLLAAPADAVTKKKRAVYHRGDTVFVSRDENGRTRIRVVIQKRSYLDPGTGALPSDRSALDYIELPNQHASGVIDNTAFGGNQTALPNQWTLPFKNNPWVGY
jgi:hypothetical protein